jgi:hypothetical protein
MKQINEKQVKELVTKLMDRKIPIYGMLFSDGNPMSSYRPSTIKPGEFSIKTYDTSEDFSYLKGTIFELFDISVQVINYYPGELDSDMIYHPLLSFKII